MAEILIDQRFLFGGRVSEWQTRAHLEASAHVSNRAAVGCKSCDPSL